MNWKKGQWYTEFGGVQVVDYFSFYVKDFPVFAFRRWMKVQGAGGDWVTYGVAVLGISVSWQGEPS